MIAAMKKALEALGICESMLPEYHQWLSDAQYELRAAVDAAERQEHCPAPEMMGEHACKNKSQCWEPCGDLGHSEAHVRVAKKVEPVFVVFDGPPSHEAGRFVEVETACGKSINVGEWHEYPADLPMSEGLWRLGPFYTATPPAIPAWQPIETAPRDGTDILAMYMHIDTQIVHNAFWNDYEDAEEEEIGWWSYEHSEVSRIKLDDWMTPTHWMPLPAAPKKEGE